MNDVASNLGCRHAAYFRSRLPAGRTSAQPRRFGDTYPGSLCGYFRLKCFWPTHRQISFRWVFSRKDERNVKKYLETLKSVPDTLVFYEAPHRICATLKDLIDVFGSERIAFMAREITKTFETYIYGTIGELFEKVSADSNQQRGEIVLVLAGNVVSNDSLSADAEKILKLLIKELPLAKAASLAAKITGGDKKQLYQLALTLQNKSALKQSYLAAWISATVNAVMLKIPRDETDGMTM